MPKLPEEVKETAEWFAKPIKEDEEPEPADLSFAFDSPADIAAFKRRMFELQCNTKWKELIVTQGYNIVNKNFEIEEEDKVSQPKTVVFTSLHKIFLHSTTRLG